MENDYENINLRQNIRKIRSIRGFSQEYVAEKLNLSQSSHSKLEFGKTFISEETKDKIADVLEVDKKLLEHYNDNMVFNYCTTQSGHIIGNNGESIYNNSLSEKPEAVYAQLIAEKDERTKLLERLLSKEK